MLPDKTDIGISQLKHCFNAHCLQFFTDAAPGLPDLSSTGSKAINFLCLSRLDRIHHSSGLPLPLFRRVIGQLCRGFSLGYADTDREVRPAQNRLANFPAKVGKIATIPELLSGRKMPHQYCKFRSVERVPPALSSLGWTYPA